MPDTPDQINQGPDLRSRLKPGVKVRVTQQIAARNYAWPSEIVGELVSFSQKQTGSWYAHSRGEKLWLDRMVIKKEDGEVSTLNLDEFSRVEIVDD
ncbi:MAG: hypothetical protein AAGD32_14100 [Planctomycetota bacterium]